MTSDLFLKRMLTFVFEAGKIALDLIEDSEPSLKADNSVVTKADTKISKLAREELSDLLISSQHLLIEEENADAARYLDQSLLNKAPYIWAVDPIDGSRNYANRMPNFGISIGLLKNLKPWLGVVYFPSLSELFYCDGENAFFVDRAFTTQEKKTPIRPQEQKITNSTIFLCIDHFSKYFRWDHKDCRMMIQSCAAIDMCWPAAARACGSILKCSLWDFAGGWPIAQKAGLHLMNFESGKIMDELDIRNFLSEKKSWKLRDFHLVCSQKNFPILKKKITKI